MQTKVKEEPKVQAKPPEPAKIESNLTPLTPEEQALARRIAQGSTEWQTINERDVEDFSLSEDPFKLPEPAQRLQAEKKYKFRWFTRDPHRADEVKTFAKIRKWWIVNRVQPVVGAFDDFIDGTTGGVHCLDQLLFFKPWWLWEAEQKLDQQLAQANLGLPSKDGTETNDARWSAGKRTVDGKSLGRQEIGGSDIIFRGEAEVDAEQGKVIPQVSEGDLNEEV